MRSMIHTSSIITYIIYLHSVHKITLQCSAFAVLISRAVKRDISHSFKHLKSTGKFVVANSYLLNATNFVCAHWDVVYMSDENRISDI